MNTNPMSSENPKQLLLAQFAAVAKALGHAHRLELLELVAQGERTVESLVQASGLSIANTSQHLQQLQRSGLLLSRRSGKHVFYRLADEAVVEVLVLLRGIAERNIAEVQRLVAGYFHQRDGLEPVSREELIGRLRAGSVTVLDVRPEDEFRAGHLPGALNMPLRQLEKRLNELPQDQEIVAYCRSHYCMLAFEAVALLRRHGFHARRLGDGFPEWKVAGLPVAGAARG